MTESRPRGSTCGGYHRSPAVAASRSPWLSDSYQRERRLVVRVAGHGPFQNSSARASPGIISPKRHAHPVQPGSPADSGCAMIKT